MSSLMPYLKQHNVESIALEIDSAYQQQVDDYLASGTVSDAWFFKNTSYFSVIESAKANHLGIVCMDDIRYHNADNRYLADYTMFENIKRLLIIMKRQLCLQEHRMCLRLETLLAGF